MRSKNNFLVWFKNQKLGKKILYTFMLATIVPLLVGQVLLLYVISNNMKEKVDDLIVSQLVQISERTNLTMEVYTNLVYQIYTDDQIIDGIKAYKNRSEEDSARSYREISDRIQQYGVSTGGIECISVILPDGQNITYDFGLASAVDNLWNDYPSLTEIEPYVQAQQGNNMVITSTMQFTRGNQEERIFHISKQMYDYANIEEGPIATIVMSVNESVLNAVCSSGQDEKSGEIYSINFIMDPEKNVLSYPNPLYAGVQISPDRSIKEFVEKTGQLRGKDIAINTYVDEESGWTFYNAYDREYIFKDIRKIQYLTLIIGAFLLVASITLIRYTVRLIEHSTKNIIGGIKEVQNGQLDVEISVDSKDEMGQIADNFNTMTHKVKDLIQEVTEVTEMQKDAEIRALEAQINPHFLYNTLDSINWMAIDKEEYEISTMLRNLGVILRYSINKSNQMITVDEMTDWLEKYISLQRMRFNDAFDSEIHVAEETRKIKIHKLLIQPFVENAIIHGFKGIESGGILRIDVVMSEQENVMNIIIEDNGKGMEQDTVLKFNDTITAVQDDGRSIGLHNAFKRMRMYYGNKGAWNVRSIPDIGTIITLKIPVEGEKADEDRNR